VNLSGNRLCGVWLENGKQMGTYSVEGIRALADALEANGSLTEVDVGGNSLKDAGIEVLTTALTMSATCKLQSLKIDENQITSTGAKAVAAYVAISASLTKLSLASNKLGEEGAKAICEALKGHKTLRELDVSGHAELGSNIGGPAGVKHVADMLVADGSLRFVNVLSNQLDAESATRLLQAKVQTPGLRSLSGLTRVETEIDFSSRGFRRADAMLLSVELPTMSSLTSLSLAGNDLGGGIEDLSTGLRESSSLTMLDLRGKGYGGGRIGPSGATALASAMAAMASLSVSDLRFNNLDTESATMLAAMAKKKQVSLCGIKPGQTEAKLQGSYPYHMTVPDAILLTADLAVRSDLTSIDLSRNDLDAEAAEAISPAVAVSASLTALDLERNSIGPEGARALGEALKVNCSLTKLSLAQNNLEEDGTRSICEALKGNTTLKELDLRGGTFTTGSNIGGPVGAAHVADMLCVNGHLARVDVSCNCLDRGGIEVRLLRYAVKGREGFVLIDDENDSDCSSAGSSRKSLSRKIELS
jgi:Ran GTPase-activating protein (RanGAP) involved in mRNA processing and transport